MLLDFPIKSIECEWMLILSSLCVYDLVLVRSKKGLSNSHWLQSLK